MKAFQIEEEQSIMPANSLVEDDEDIEEVEPRSYYDLCLWRRNSGFSRLGDYYSNVFKTTNYLFYMCRLNPLSQVKLRCRDSCREYYEFCIKVPSKLKVGFRFIPIHIYVEDGCYFDAITGKRIYRSLSPDDHGAYVGVQSDVLPYKVAKYADSLNEEQFAAYEKGIDEFNKLIQKNYKLDLEKQKKWKASIDTMNENNDKAQVYLAYLQRRRGNKNEKRLK